MIRQKSKISIVIPVYNEEQQLSACLEAIAHQTVMPLEVIIVDNNSTDKTAEIARSYPFVRLISESQQGTVHARNCGFNAARGEIIGRVDTDTRLAPDWTTKVQQIFEDASVDAVSGSIGFHDAPFPEFFSKIDGFFRRYLAYNLARYNQLFLYGSNMAIRTSVWQQLESSLCHNSAFHEDIDMAAHFADTDFKVIFDDRMRVLVSARRLDSPPRSYYAYVLANGRTYAAHGLKGRYFMYPVEWVSLAMYMPLRVLYRSYETSTGRFSLAHFMRPAYAQRVSPISESSSL